MARYVIANRRAGRFTSNEKLASRSAVATALSELATARILEEKTPEDPLARRVLIVEADPAEMEARMREVRPDVIIEPELFYGLMRTPPPDLINARKAGSMPMAAGPMAQITITATGGGAALSDALVYLFVRKASDLQQFEAKTNAQGLASFSLPAGWEPMAAAVLPRAGFWSMIARGAQVFTAIECPPLPTGGPFGWWHNAIGIDATKAQEGAGVKVGIADSGVGQHLYLKHVTRIGAFINGGHDKTPSAAMDVEQHGTHVTGTIGARPKGGDYAGVAPSADIFVARIFEEAGEDASNADIANAIDELSRTHGVDLINLSIGGPTPSKVILDAIVDAAERGTLCIVAAGNSTDAVKYPAAHSEVVAVSALGLEGWGPPGSVTASRLPQEHEKFGSDHLFLGNFSCFGPELACAGPGVGIIAPVPATATTSLYAALDGTSMAAPVVCGALAALLARSPQYLALPRDSTRTAEARRVLDRALRTVGLSSSYQGRGVPKV